MSQLSIYTPHQNYSPPEGRVRRTFEPRKSRQYGIPAFTPDKLVRYSPKYGYSRIFNFPFLGSPFVPRMNTVVIQVHGIAIPNCKNDPNGRAAGGVFFGPNSSHNAGFAVPDSMPQTNNRAVLEAVRKALSQLISMRHSVLDPRWQEAIIMTNSEYVKHCLSCWVWKWETNGWQHIGRGGDIENRDALQEVHGLLTYIETRLNMSVRFWKVEREHVLGADSLAKASLGG